MNLNVIESKIKLKKSLRSKKPHLVLQELMVIKKLLELANLKTIHRKMAQNKEDLEKTGANLDQKLQVLLERLL